MIALPAFLRDPYPVLDRFRPFLQRIQMRSFWIGCAASIILGTIYLVFVQGGSSSSATTQSMSLVERRTISSSVKATGKVTFSSDQQMQFNQRGTITTVNFKEGDSVKRGDIIAELDQTSVEADIRSAQLGIGASSLQLQQLLANRDQQVIDVENTARQTERQLTQAQNDLQVAKEQLPSTLASAKRSVVEKQAALDQAKADLAKTKETEVQSIGSTAQSILTSSEKLLDSFFSVLTRDSVARPNQGNYDLPIPDILYRDIGLKQQTEFSYYGAVKLARAMHDQYGTTLVTEHDPTILLQALTDAEALASSVQSLGENAYQMLQGAATDSITFPASDLASYRSTVSTNRSSAAGLVSSAETAKANLAAVSSGGGIPSNTIQQKQDAVTAAEHALVLAQENLTIAQTKTPADLQAQEDSVVQMQEDLQSKQASVDSTTTSVDVTISLKRNEIAQKAASLEKLRKTLDDYRLVAPFDGVIRQVEYKVGDNLLGDSTDSAKFVKLENMDTLVVTIPLDQVDVVRVKKEMTATVTLDALPGHTFQGVVAEIKSTPITTSGVVSYNVDVELPTPKDLTILSGMTATVIIETARKENVLAVPNLAILRTNGKAAVKKADGTSVSVEIGVTDGKYTEIVSGLSEGDAVLSKNLASASTTSTASTTNPGQIFRLTGGGGGPPGGGRGG